MRISSITWLAFTLLTPLSVASADDEQSQLILERAARVLASSYASGNANEQLFSNAENYTPTSPSDIIHNEISINIVTEHALDDTKEEIKSLTGVKEYEHWLHEVRSSYRFQDNLEVRTLGACSAGCCEFPILYGIRHNTLYLTNVCFIYKEGRPYAKSISLLDGD